MNFTRHSPPLPLSALPFSTNVHTVNGKLPEQYERENASSCYPFFSGELAIWTPVLASPSTYFPSIHPPDTISQGPPSLLSGISTAQDVSNWFKEIQTSPTVFLFPLYATVIMATARPFFHCWHSAQICEIKLFSDCLEPSSMLFFSAVIQMF